MPLHTRRHFKRPKFVRLASQKDVTQRRQIALNGGRVNDECRG